MVTSRHSAPRRPAVVPIALLLLGFAPPALAVPLTNGGRLNSWETGDELNTQGWYGLTWNNPTDWYASFKAHTDGLQSLQLIYTSPSGGSNFNWGGRFESWSLGAYDSPARVAWENPWREAIADDPNFYSITFDAIYLFKTGDHPGIPAPPATWANLAVLVQWGDPDAGLKSKQWGSVANVWMDHEQTVGVRLPFSELNDGGPIKTNLQWIQFHVGDNGGWTAGQEAAIYIDDLRIRLDGDANGDGHVDADDIALTDRGAANGLHGWENGDFDLDGTVAPADYLILDRSYAREHGGLSPGLLAEREARFGDGYVSQLVAAVPEPSALAAGGMAALPLVRRRRV